MVPVLEVELWAGSKNGTIARTSGVFMMYLFNMASISTVALTSEEELVARNVMR